MKLVIGALAALLMVPAAAAPVRYEAEGIRVGGDLVAGPQLLLKSVDASTLLVSGSAVENIGAPVAVALDASHDVVLQTGLRLVRRADGFLLSSHGPAILLDVAGRTLQAASSLAFKVTAAGFDFGALGAVEATTFSASASASTGPQDDIVSPERRLQTRAGQRAFNARRRVHRDGNPFATSAFADRAVFATLSQLSIDGSN